MNKKLINSLMYKIFLIVRAGNYSDSKLRTQISKRGHSLDKSLAQKDKTSIKRFCQELKILLAEFKKRKFQADDTINWVWKLIFRAEFGEILKVDKLKRKIGGDADLEKSIRNRRSVRVWKSKKVDKKIIYKAIEIAKWAPSSCNRQLTRVLILDKKKEYDFLMKTFSNQTFVRRAPMILVILSQFDEYGEEEKQYSYLDSGAFIENLLLVLSQMGIGTCWLGIKKDKEYLSNVKKFKNEFGFAEKLYPVSLVALGYQKKEVVAPPRKNTQEIITNAKKDE